MIRVLVLYGRYCLWGVCLVVIACENPFSTREPEPPESVGNRWIPPFSADIVLVNLQNAITDRNTENYVRCFSDSSRTGRDFRFEPETAIANTNPGFFINWDLEDERFYFSQLRTAIEDDSTSSLRLDSLQTITFSDSAIFLQSYDLTVRHNRQNRGDPGRVKGELRFRMIKDQFGEWSIYRWADFGAGSEPTWSALKVAFGQ